MPLVSIQEGLNLLPQDRPPTNKDWGRLADLWRDDLDDRIIRLTLLRDRLTGCLGCGCLSVQHCPLLNPDDRAREEGVGARYLEPPTLK
jgi:MerR family redox-sensitive transcriptional activator SoxR